jgi:hypothetical protein
MRQRTSLFAGDTVALESIAFQRDQMLFKELTLWFKAAEKVAVKDLPDSDLALQLPGIIKHHTGLNCVVYFQGGEYDLACSPPMATPNNVFWNRLDMWVRELIGTADADKILADTSKKPIGTVDIKRGKVGGVFSDMQNILMLPPELAVSKKYDAEEKAGGVIHELGHLFAFFEYITAALTTNYILSAISKQYDTVTSVKDREVLLTKIKSQQKLHDLDAAALAKSNDKKVVEVVVITSIAKELHSEIGSNVFDINGWELMADQYAARQGAARQVVTFLDKLYKGSGSIKYRSLPVYLFCEAVKVASLVVAPFSGGLSLIVFAGLAMRDSVELSDTLYGTLKTRFGRMRDQLVAELKEKGLSDERQQGLAQDIQVIDDLLKDFKERQQLLGYVLDFISPFQRQRISQEQLQRQLEQLAHNELFVRSAALKQYGA